MSFVFTHNTFFNDEVNQKDDIYSTSETFVNKNKHLQHPPAPQKTTPSFPSSSSFSSQQQHGGDTPLSSKEKKNSPPQRDPQKNHHHGSFDFPSTYMSTSALPGVVSPLESLEYRFLYFMPFCPLSRKIFIGLREKGIAFQEFYEKSWDPSKTVLKLNPFGELPIFVDHQEICQNDLVALDYLEEAYKDCTPLLGRNLTQKGETRFLVSWFDRLFYHDVYWTLFYERALKRQAKQGFPDTTLLKKGRENLKHHLTTLEYWTQHRPYLNGYQFSWADIAGIAHLSCIDYLGDILWEDYPATKEWYTKVKSRPSVRSCLDWSFPGLDPVPHYRLLDF